MQFKDLRKKDRESSITQHYADQKKTESKNKKEEDVDSESKKKTKIDNKSSNLRKNIEKHEKSIKV